MRKRKQDIILMAYFRKTAVVYAKQEGEICIKVSGGDLCGETQITVEN